jgi:V-type H+-transporting ATPase subunit G
MDSMRGHEGIQMLLTAEQEAQQIVTAARNCKNWTLSLFFALLHYIL